MRAHTMQARVRIPSIGPFRRAYGVLASRAAGDGEMVVGEGKFVIQVMDAPHVSLGELEVECFAEGASARGFDTRKFRALLAGGAFHSALELEFYAAEAVARVGAVELRWSEPHGANFAIPFPAPSARADLSSVEFKGFARSITADFAELRFLPEGLEVVAGEARYRCPGSTARTFDGACVSVASRYLKQYAAMAEAAPSVVVEYGPDMPAKFAFAFAGGTLTFYVAPRQDVD